MLDRKEILQEKRYISRQACFYRNNQTHAGPSGGSCQNKLSLSVIFIIILFLRTVKKLKVTTLT